MTIRVTRQAARDLEDALTYIEQRRPRSAEALAQRFLDLLVRLEGGEFDGPESRLRSGTRVRSWPISPYRVFYRRDGGLLVVLRLYHQRRKPL